MLKNTSERWGAVSKFVHWVFAILVGCQVYLGFWLTEESAKARISGDDTILLWLEVIHHTTGFMLLFTALFRMAWHTAHITPDMPAGFARYQAVLAKLTHLCFYALMLVFPLSGWALSTTIGSEQFPVPINFFMFEMPGLNFLRDAPGPYNTFDYYRTIHQWCWWIGGWVLGLHALAALYHQFILKDNILLRMVPDKLTKRWR